MSKPASRRGFSVNVFLPTGDPEVTQDYLFTAPSTAATTLLGRTANGRIEWKTKDGRTLKELQEAEASG